MTFLTSLIILISPFSWANDSRESFPFPVRLNISTQSPDTYFLRADESSRTINKFLSSPIANANITILTETQIRIELQSPIEIQLSNKEGTEDRGTRVIRSLIVNHPDPENLEILSRLRKGDIAVFDTFKESALRDIIDQVNSGRVHEAFRAVENVHYSHFPRLQIIDALEFFVYAEEAGLRAGANVEHMHLKVRDFANILGSGWQDNTPKTNSLKKIITVFPRNSWLMREYEKAVQKIRTHKDWLFSRNWQPPKTIQTDNRDSSIEKNSKVVRINGALRCIQVFTP